MGLQAEGLGRVGVGLFQKSILTYFPRGTLIESAAKWTCPGKRTRSAQDLILQQVRQSRSTREFAIATRAPLVPKLKYWNAAKRTFAHQRINNLRPSVLEGLGTRCAVCKSARAQEKREFCTQNSFFKETESSQVSIIPRARTLGGSSAHAF